MSAANRGARYGLETPSSYGRIFPQRAVPTAKFLRAIRGCRRRFPARRTQGGAWGWLLCHPKARRRPCGTPEANRSEGTCGGAVKEVRSEEHTSELQSLMRISYAVFCLKKKNIPQTNKTRSKDMNVTTKGKECI